MFSQAGTEVLPRRDEGSDKPSVTIEPHRIMVPTRTRTQAAGLKVRCRYHYNTAAHRQAACDDKTEHSIICRAACHGKTEHGICQAACHKKLNMAYAKPLVMTKLNIAYAKPLVMTKLNMAYAKRLVMKN